MNIHTGTVCQLAALCDQQHLHVGTAQRLFRDLNLVKQILPFHVLRARWGDRHLPMNQA